jgi:hypothetical protein
MVPVLTNEEFISELSNDEKAIIIVTTQNCSKCATLCAEIEKEGNEYNIVAFKYGTNPDSNFIVDNILEKIGILSVPFIIYKEKNKIATFFGSDWEEAKKWITEQDSKYGK